MYDIARYIMYDSVKDILCGIFIDIISMILLDILCIIMLSVNFFCNISSYDILAYITKNYIALIYYNICQNIVWTYITEEIYRKHNNT
jgi:hypothetical protein